MRTRVLARRARFREPRPELAALWWLIAGVLLLGVAAGCRIGVPVVDTGTAPPAAPGTISGTVRGPSGTSSIEGRVVEVVNIETDERQRVVTNNAGGFTVKVKPGKYRVEITLREGETILKGPGVMQVNRSDVDAHADFVIGSRRDGAASRPRGPVLSIDPALGSPIA